MNRQVSVNRRQSRMVTKNKEGFVHLEILIVILIIAIVGVVVFVFGNNNGTPLISQSTSSPTPQQSDLEVNLLEICTESSGCPREYCTIGCVGGGPQFGCVAGCVPRDCQEFDAKNCPVGDICSLWTNSVGEKVCYYNSVNDDHACGETGYYGQKVDCCEGFIRRSGKLLEDGSCDMAKGGYQDQFPYCLACGDGQCGPRENKCNCPEDCQN